MPTSISRPIAEAVALLFPGLTISKHPELKTGISTIVDTDWFGAIKVSPKEGHQRKRILIPADRMTLLWNCILIHGLVPSSRTVGEIVKDSHKRNSFADWAHDLLVGRQSVAAVGLLAPELTAFLAGLRSSRLDNERLPNPFSVLPQLALGGKIGVLQAQLAQITVLSQGDSMMRAYFDGNLAEAARLAETIPTDSDKLKPYKDMILNEFNQRQRFSCAFAEMLK